MKKGVNMKTLNQEGFAIVIVIMILAMLTIIGVSSLRMSRTEVQISTNLLIQKMCFYAAESGTQVAKLDLLDPEFLPEDQYGNPDWMGTDTYLFPTNAQYIYEISHQVDEDGNVLRYGDTNGDHIWEVNTTVGRPLEFVSSHGTHVGRGGNAVVETTLQFRPAFEMPNTALWVENPDNVDFKGNATISGDSLDIDLCPDVPDVLHHINPVNPMDEPKHYGDEFVHEPSGGMYPFGPVKDSLLERADYVGNEFPTEDAEASTADNPIVIIIEGDLEINNEDLKLPAHGILYVDGNLRINGNVEWNGLIITTGDTSIGNGTADINGSLVTGESADVDISGTIVVQYDCTTLNNLFDSLSGYRMTSWRQI
jgi:type II secretory pathway pseudopilin PulG